LWGPIDRASKTVSQLAIIIALSIGASPVFFASRLPADAGSSMWARLPRRIRYLSLRHVLGLFRIQRNFGFAPSRGISQATLSLWELNKNYFTAQEQVILASLIGESVGTISPLLEFWSNFKKSNELSSLEFLELRAASLAALFSSGHFREAFSLSRELSVAIDEHFSRKPGLWAENHHFTAVGHLALLHYLLIAIEAGTVDANRIVLHRCNTAGNRYYADWLHEKAVDLGVSVLTTHSTHSPHEPNLELWPLADGYRVSWHLHAPVLGELETRRDKSQLINCEVSGQALDYLASLGWDQSRPTVGFHIQNSLPRGRGLRNSPPNKYVDCMNRLISEGYNVVVLNLPSGITRGVISLDHSFDNTLSEAVNLIIWQQSKFFVGNLSGGSHPPGAFLTPTLWVDQHPTASFRAPGTKDLFLPKLPFVRGQNTYLRFEEIFYQQHSRAQTENVGVLKSWGYGIREASSFEIDCAVREMQNITEGHSDSLSRNQQRVAEVYASNGFLSGGNISPSFIEEWGDKLIP
jgi:putative glycosyltransferase (TIGR04372 family)